jgi:hypothetical protein
MDGSLMIRVAIVVAAALGLGYLYIAYFRRDRHKSQHMLDEFVGVVDAPVVTRSPWGYERLQGRLDGAPVHIDLIPDSLITRTLPTLWLEVRLARQYDAFLCVITLCNGMEYFADEVDEGTLLNTPRTWDETTRVRGTSQASVALLRQVAGLDLGAYPHLKLLAFDTGGLKVVMRCARGDLTQYRVMRSATFPEDAVPPSLVNETLSLVRDLERVLERGEEIA